jgi:hypothetical protein
MYSRGWVSQLSEDDIRLVLARYKEHVVYWNIAPEIVKRELTELAQALGRHPDEFFREYDKLPAARLPSDYFNGSRIGGYW